MIHGAAVSLDLAHPVFAGRTGRGVSVAVVDSGVNPHHPHLNGVAGGVAVGEDGEWSDDFVDVLGHGTAVAAAIHEKAPDAALHAVRVFGRELATRAEVLVRAIDWATERGIRLINLSLGTANREREPLLRDAVERAAVRGVLIVSACQYRGAPWLPGCLDGVVGVELDWSCPRDELQVGADDQGHPVLRASGYPRPIPGVPPKRNLHGISFAVANVTGFLSRLLEEQPGTTTPEHLLQLLG